ncbi:MAG: CoA transferase [Hyphomicrobiaceae bacterium]
MPEPLMFPEIRSAFETNADTPMPVDVVADGAGDLPSWYEVSQLAVEAIGAAASELSRLSVSTGRSPPSVTIDRARSSFWFKTSLDPQGWSLPPIWDAIAGDYRTADGWIRLHTNAAHHRKAALTALDLGHDADKPAVAEAVAQWRGDDLETAIVSAAGCAAVMRSHQAWLAHAQGTAVAHEPLVAWTTIEQARPSDRVGVSPGAPLSGVRVLDLTRVLAGPVSTRLLAAFGADVLRIDPPFWSEATLEPEMTVGKRCAGLDLRQADDRATFEGLLREADVFVHGYRSDALEGLGYGAQELRQYNPRLVDVALCAYGWTGPWAQRRGFDSLVQMSSGIAEFGMRSEHGHEPRPLPAQALDHATGYLMAAAVLQAVRRQRSQGCVLSARLSLARTAHLLASSERSSLSGGLRVPNDADFAPEQELTVWGPARRMLLPFEIEDLEPHWRYPAGRLRSQPAAWL